AVPFADLDYFYTDLFDQTIDGLGSNGQDMATGQGSLFYSVSPSIAAIGQKIGGTVLSDSGPDSGAAVLASHIVGSALFIQTTPRELLYGSANFHIFGHVSPGDQIFFEIAFNASAIQNFPIFFSLGLTQTINTPGDFSIQQEATGPLV